MVRLSGVRTIVLGLVLVFVAGTALAAARHALVIGVNAYEDVTPLKKAVGDAEAMRDTLTALGFEVTLALNPDRRSLNRAVADFEHKLQPGDVALVHFSGHGVEINGQNYLLPADIPKPRAGESDFLAAEALSLGNLVQRVSSTGATTRIFIIDACRDNPFDPSGTRSLGAGRGLARVEAPKGTFILYSAGYHETALDELNPTDPAPTSVYTRVLTQRLAEPGKPISAIAKEVRGEVESLAKSVGHEQRPAYYDELSGEFYFASAEAPPPTPKPVVTASTPAASGPSGDAEAFKAAQTINTQEAWQIFLGRYPSGFYADMARAALAKLEAPAPEAKAPAPEPAHNRGADSLALIRDFVVYDYLGGDISDARHLGKIYADRVDYYGLGRVSLARIISDKLDYAAKWPRNHYELVPGTFDAAAIGSSDRQYLVSFQSDFRVSNGSRTIAGVSETRLIVDLSSGVPRIVDEKSSVISRR